MRRHVVLIAVLAPLLSCGGGSSSGNTTTPPPVTGPVSVTLASVATGFSNPLDIETSRDNTRRFFVVEQGGKIRILQNGAILPTPFLDITSKVTSGGETGLLGLTFHPSYTQNRKFYVNYTQTVGGQLQTVIAEFQASATNANVADPTTERDLLIVNQPFANHNAGQLGFGSDGYLYFGLGDGGSGGDPLRNGQNTQVILGKMLRIDVNNTSVGKPYAIPADNPFASNGQG